MKEFLYTNFFIQKNFFEDRYDVNMQLKSFFLHYSKKKKTLDNIFSKSNKKFEFLIDNWTKLFLNL